MNYNPSGKSLPISLGLTPTRIKQLNQAFTMVCESLPMDARRTELRARLAIFINTPEEGYYMGEVAREYMNRLKQTEPLPISCN